MNKNIQKKLIALSILGIITLNNKNVYASDINNEVKVVKAIDKVNIRSLNNITSDIVGMLDEGDTLEYILKLSNGWYKVLYNDEIAYVNSDFVVEDKEIKDNTKYNKMVYFKEDKKVVTEIDEYEIIDKYEMAEVLYKNDEYSILKINDKIGYTTNDNLEKLPKNFVVVDISDQKVNYYDKNNIIFESDVVTGLPTESRETHLGYYKIFEKSYNRDLVAEDNSYRSYVDVMMKFNKGQGLHDAQYHKDYDENGKLVKSHGWRSISEFGGETYLHDGSHGCVNMPHDKAMELSEKVNVGTRVLVKK